MGAVASPKPNSNMCSEALFYGTLRQDRRFWTKLQSFGQSGAPGALPSGRFHTSVWRRPPFPEPAGLAGQRGTEGPAAAWHVLQGGRLMLSALGNLLLPRE